MDSTLTPPTPKFRTDAPHNRLAGTERPEARIRRELLAHGEWQFERLIVRRIPGGVCLEGVMLSQANMAEINSCVRQFDGVESVLNQLIVCQRPPKG